jgi:hypothetical protein
MPHPRSESPPETAGRGRRDHPSPSCRTEDLIYRASRRVVEAGFAADDSVLTPGGPVWTQKAADASPDDLRAQVATIAAAVAGGASGPGRDLRANAAPSPT